MFGFAAKTGDGNSVNRTAKVQLNVEGSPSRQEWESHENQWELMYEAVGKFVSGHPDPALAMSECAAELRTKAKESASTLIKSGQGGMVLKTTIPDVLAALAIESILLEFRRREHEADLADEDSMHDEYPFL